MNDTTMNTALKTIAAQQRVMQQSEGSIDPSLKKLLAEASVLTPAPTEPLKKVKMLVRAHHFDSLFAAAMIIDACKDTDFSVSFIAPAFNGIPKHDGKAEVMVIGLNHFTTEQVEQLGNATVLSYSDVKYEAFVPRKWWAFWKDDERKANPIKQIKQIQHRDENGLVGFGALGDACAATLIDKAGVWLYHNSKQVTNATLLRARVAAMRLCGGVGPVVNDGKTPVDVLPLERKAEEAMLRSMLFNLSIQLTHALRQSDCRAALEALCYDCDERIYKHALAQIQTNYHNSAVKELFKIRDQSPIRIGGPYKTSPYRDNHFSFTVGFNAFLCSEGEWEIMREIAKIYASNFISYHDIGGTREWRVVCKDKALAYALAHKVGQNVWDDGHCIRSYSAKP